MRQPKPEWLRVKFRQGTQVNEVKAILDKLSLHSVCDEAVCPNRMECFSRRTATFMIMGRICTRNCTFCAVEKTQVQPLDPDEPVRVAEAVKALNLKHVVITSVTRDDLADGGASHFAKVIGCIRKADENVIIEVLIPDFQGNCNALSIVVDAKPEIINHNVETVPRLHSEVRPMADYWRSLALLKEVKELDDRILTKSGLMVGLGEKEEEVDQVLKDLRAIGCNFITIGQYLPPTKQHHPLVEYIHPEIFEKYKQKGIQMGFDHVASGPLVRSSYHADKAYQSK